MSKNELEEKDILELTYADIDYLGDEFGKKFNKITTSQIRKIHAELLKIKRELYKKSNKKESIDKVKLLRYKLAYLGAKAHDSNVKNLCSKLMKYIDDINNIDDNDDKKKAFDNFYLLFEAILAYHKYYGGKD